MVIITRCSLWHPWSSTTYTFHCLRWHAWSSTKADKFTTPLFESNSHYNTLSSLTLLVFNNIYFILSSLTHLVISKSRYDWCSFTWEDYGYTSLHLSSKLFRVLEYSLNFHGVCRETTSWTTSFTQRTGERVVGWHFIESSLGVGAMYIVYESTLDLRIASSYTHLPLGDIVEPSSLKLRGLSHWHCWRCCCWCWVV